METTKPIEYVNTFWGSKVFDRQSHGILSKKWFFFKPQTGNLSPACTLPHSAFTVVPYAGGYPTGYGIYNPGYSAVPTTIAKTNFIRGFTHFCHSGTGFIGNFYNYFMLCPTDTEQTILSEIGGPGWYEAVTSNFTAKIALDNTSANYELALKSGNTIRIYPAYGGLANDNKRCTVDNFEWSYDKTDDTISFCVKLKGFNLFFAISSKQPYSVDCADNYCALQFMDGNIRLSVAYSFTSEAEAISRVKASSFNYATAREVAEDIWNKELSVVTVAGDTDVKKLFYSALYNALKKPCLDGSFVSGVFDLATMWDMYKTALPLKFMLYPETSTKIVNGFATCFLDGRFPNAKLMDIDFSKSTQALCLMSISIATAYLLGVKADYDRLLPLAKSDVEYQIKRANGRTRITHNLDLIDAYYALSACGIEFDRFVVDYVKNVERKLYCKNGLLKHGLARKFYEGTYKNYSFRVSSATDTRLMDTETDRLSRELDAFFGFTGSDVYTFTKPTYDKIVNLYGKLYRRFEGMNNQPDMESMFMYHKIGDYRKTEDVVNEIIAHNFNLTDGGMPGNDDSGGLTSWLALNILGLYPVVGTGDILIGSPQIDSATINLDGALEIVTVGRKTGKHVKRVTFNGTEIANRKIAFTALKSGGRLIVEYE